MNYPTKEKILRKEPKFRKGVILITKLWKRLSMKSWKTSENWVKMERIGLLIEALSALHRKESPKIQLDIIYMYDEKNKIIHLDRNNPSIISALHELAHYLFNANERKATIWSVWLFKICFPSEFVKLKWKGHMLVKF